MPWGLPRIIDSPSKYKPHIGYPGVQGNPDVSHVEITLELPADTLIVKGAPYEPLSSLRVAQLRLHFWVTLRPHTKNQITSPSPTWVTLRFHTWVILGVQGNPSVSSQNHTWVTRRRAQGKCALYQCLNTLRQVGGLRGHLHFWVTL